MGSGNINMLGIRKVKLHGMSSNRWTTKDKLIQYKGLINLYTRDRKVIEFDTSIARKKLDQDLKQLQKDVERDREKLDNAIRGDKQQLRNTLAEHKEMQMAYQHSPPKKVIECLRQINFSKRKTSDRLEYELQQKINELEELKLSASVLEDRLKYAFLGQIKQEKEAQLITGKVQDAILKREAAIAIRQSYEKMIAIMKKDALYFNAILETIQNDGLIQNRCFLNATKLGQLATEYLDDRRLEFLQLEKVVKHDMNERRNDLISLKDEVFKNTKRLQKLLRKDDDITTCNIPGLDDSPRSKSLKKDMKTIEISLENLKGATLVPEYEKIYPCMQDQAKQRERLDELSKRVESHRNIIATKLMHAELLAHSLNNTMVETTGEYRKRKAEILKRIADLAIIEKYEEKKISGRMNLIAEATNGLRHLHNFTRLTDKDSSKKRQKPPAGAGGGGGGLAAPIQAIPPDPEDSDGAVIIPMILETVSLLMPSDKEDLDSSKTEESYRLFEHAIKQRTIMMEFNEFGFKHSSLQFSEKSHLVTREDIKKMSREIVEANTKNDDLIPAIPQPPTKKK